MGHGARLDPAAVGSAPGAGAGGYRKRAGEFCAADALERRARGGLLEDPRGALNVSRRCTLKRSCAERAIFDGFVAELVKLSEIQSTSLWGPRPRLSGSNASLRSRH